MKNSRRSFLQICAGGLTPIGIRPLTAGAAAGERQTYFLAEAERMRRQAVAAGDQPFGAVLVIDDRVVAHGPSRVVTDRNPNAHAERVAIWEAQKALGRRDLTDAVLYSTSRPCLACETVAAEANVARMIHGAGGTDAGKPQKRL